MANPENLRPPPSSSVAREMGAKGGKKAAESKRKRKFLSQLYGEFLAERFAIKINGVDEKITGADLVNRVMKEVLARGGGPAVTLMKEMREATEGSKVKVSAPPESGNSVTTKINLDSLSDAEKQSLLTALGKTLQGAK